jgi:UDP:flavonoid glycosyltransferase YjiC (YdhE family)
VRGLAVLDRLARRAPDLKAVLVAPRRHAAWGASRGVTVWSPPETAQAKQPLAAWAASLPTPRRLVSDVFPRGVLGELEPVLPRLERRAWLVSRRVRPRAWLAPETRDALESRYERLLWCEPPPGELAGLELAQGHVGPILIARPEDCLDASAARAELRLAPGDPVVLMLGSGSAEEQHDRLRLLLKARARLAQDGGPRFQLVALSARLPPAREPGLVVQDVFPAMRVLRAAHLLVAGGGYASWHEAHALGLPALFLPQPRPWDDQAARVAATRPPTTPEALESDLARLLRDPPRPEPTPTPDGADAVATALLEAG